MDVIDFIVQFISLQYATTVFNVACDILLHFDVLLTVRLSNKPT